MRDWERSNGHLIEEHDAVGLAAHRLGELPALLVPQLDAAHHMAPFTDYRELRAAGSRIITHADGHYIYDSDGNRILDAMAGLWCVNVGYGRRELVDAASSQMGMLPYYNNFFKTTNCNEIGNTSRSIKERSRHIIYSSSSSI